MGKPGKSRVKFSRDAPNADALRAAAARAATTSSDAVEAGEEEEEEEEEKTPGINFVPCAAWVPRGASKAIPEKIELTKEELKRVIDETRRNLKDVEEDESEEVGESSGTNRDRGAAGGDDDDEEDIEAKYGFDDYDDDEAGDFGLGEVVEFGETADDPLIKQGRGDDSDSEGEDFEIRPTDNLIVTGHFEDHSSVLEVHVYNSVEGSLFVHHDMLLPACPLALEWIDCGRSGGKANLIAVGTMDPVIQVWDLDVVNCLEPCVKLGERISTKKKKKGGASGSNQCIGHTDAVLDLSWNDLNKQTLASGSVDQTTILWDFQRAKPTKVMRNFEEKVQSVLWHPSEVNMLLTGCGDGRARLYDAREEAKPTKVWKCGASVERVQWVPHSSNYFIAGLEGGLLDCYDARQKQRVWRLEAMTEPFADVAISTVCPGCVVTASEDGEIQIWDMQNPSSSEPSLIARHDMGVGKIMFIRFCPDEPFVICAGGDYGPNTFAVWDLRNNQAVADRFASRAPGSSSGGVEPMEEDS